MKTVFDVKNGGIVHIRGKFWENCYNRGFIRAAPQGFWPFFNHTISHTSI